MQINSSSVSLLTLSQTSPQKLMDVANIVVVLPEAVDHLALEVLLTIFKYLKVRGAVFNPNNYSRIEQFICAFRLVSQMHPQGLKLKIIQ